MSNGNVYSNVFILDHDGNITCNTLIIAKSIEDLERKTIKKAVQLYRDNCEKTIKITYRELINALKEHSSIVLDETIQLRIDYPSLLSYKN